MRDEYVPLGDATRRAHHERVRMSYAERLRRQEGRNHSRDSSGGIVPGNVVRDAAGYVVGVKAKPSRDVTSPLVNPYECRQKWEKEVDGETYWLPCGRCASCRRDAKHQWSGKIHGEAIYATSITFHTLTLAPGHEHSWQRPAVKRFKQRQRDRCRKWNRANPSEPPRSVRFVTVGENGSRFGRKHWHLIAFWTFDPDFWPETKWDAKEGAVGRENHPDWLLGWSQCKVVKRRGQMICGREVLLFYLSSYIQKPGEDLYPALEVRYEEGEDGLEHAVLEKRPRITASLGGGRDDDGDRLCLPLAWVHVDEWATIYAVNDRALPEFMTIPNMLNGSGRAQTMEVKNALARRACRTYVDVFRRKWGPTKPIPHSPLLERNLEDYVQDGLRPELRPTSEPVVPRPHGSVVASRPGRPARAKCKEAHFVVRTVAGGPIGALHVQTNGVVQFYVNLPRFVTPAARDLMKSSDVLNVRGGSLRGWVDLTDDLHEEIERWIASARPDGWLSDDEWAALMAERRRQRRALEEARLMAVKSFTHPLSGLGYKARNVSMFTVDDAGERVRDGPRRAVRPYVHRVP